VGHLPLQDLPGHDRGLRRANPQEQINVPGNPTNLRRPTRPEELVDAVGFNEPPRSMVEGSGRSW
jgi:hypothetical protein